MVRWLRVESIMLPGDKELMETETEEEIRITDEIALHPTRDDWHEQRERGQCREGVLASHATIVTIEVTTTSRSMTSAKRSA